MKLILATTSKFKISKFKELGLPFEAVDSEVDEKPYARDNPVELVSLLSSLKAQSVAKNHPDAIVIGFDSIGYFDGEIMEKQSTKEEAIARLKKLSGKVHLAITGVTMIKPGESPVTKVVETKVFFRELTDNEIEKYVESDEDFFNICLGYDPELGRSASFAERIEGSYHNLVSGMPLEIFAELLN